jgi:predicted DNA-binding transcriptional regulator AlpA
LEVIRLVTELSQLPPRAAELPKSPVEGLEPLLTIEQLCVWTGYSRSHVNNCRNREADPLPQLGTVAAPRFLPSEVLAWMRREYANAAESAEAP